jgi:hypothetical protein
MDHGEQSREEWEQEFKDVQHSVGPAEGLRASQIIAKKLAATPGTIPDAAHLIRGILGGALLVGAFEILSSGVANRAWFGIAALAAGLCLLLSSVQWKSKRS